MAGTRAINQIKRQPDFQETVDLMCKGDFAAARIKIFSITSRLNLKISQVQAAVEEEASRGERA